jgi:hypothetical protein
VFSGGNVNRRQWRTCGSARMRFGMSERKKWTESDAQYLVETLKADRPDLWEIYIQGEIHDKTVHDDSAQWIRMTMRKLFPEPSFDELTDLKFLFRDVVRRQLGLED